MNLYDTDFFKNWTNSPVEDVKYDDQLQSTSFQQPNNLALQYGMSQRFNNPSNWRGNLQHTYGMPGITGPNMRDVAGEVGEYGQIPGQGNVDMYTPERNIFSRAKNTLGNFKNRIGKGITGLLDNTIMGKIAAGFNPTNRRAFNFSPMLEGQLDFATGGEDEGGLGWGVDDIGRFTSGPLTGQASMSAFGRNNPLASLRARKQKIATRKIDQTAWSLNKQKEIQAAIDKLEADQRKDYKGTRGGDTGSGAFSTFDNTTKDYGPHSKGGGQGNQGSGGFSGSGAGTGAQGPAGGQSSQGNYGGGRRDGPSGRKAYGGRIGYQGGELVEQETDLIQGPQGTNEFQETVVEGQAQPSREQLEALAMEIFQLPLEELDDQQLLVVYQEAMQAQPMDEAVQEEDVQFAAQGGLAGLL